MSVADDELMTKEVPDVTVPTLKYPAVPPMVFRLKMMVEAA